MSDSGTVTDGMMVAQNVRRKSSITPTTRPIVISRVSCTSSTDARIVCVRSLRMFTFTAGGIEAIRRGNCALMRFAVSMTFASGCLKMMRKTPRLPFAQAVLRTSSGPAIACPMSLTRNGAPLR